MDVVTLAAARAAAKAAHPLRQGPQLRRLMASAPGVRLLPTVSASPPTVTVSAVAATGQTASVSAIGSAVHVYPWDARLTITGSAMVTGPLTGGALLTQTSYGAATGPIQTQSPYEVSFTLDTTAGAVDIITRDTASVPCPRLMIDGQYTTAGYSSATPGNGGGCVLVAVTGLSAGVHRITAQFGSGAVFGGLNIAPTDSVLPAARPPLKLVVVGDSFTEPTITDSTSTFARWGGWVQTLGQLLGVEAISSGSGGTGYLNPGASSRVKFRDRLTADVIAQAPDVIMWAGGINDYLYGSYSKAALQAEAAACYAAVSAALPNCLQIVLSPFYSRGYQSLPAGLLEARDAISAAAAAAGLVYRDVLETAPSVSTQASGTVQANTSVGATSVSSDVLYRVGTLLRIGASAAQELRTVSTTSGSGPYTINLNTGAEGTLAATHSIGDPIVATGPGWVTGSGRQGTTASNGSADRYCGSDSTHPTSDLAASGGHPALARTVYHRLIAAAVL